MSKQPVFTDKAPAPIKAIAGPIYNQAIVANGIVFCSGQIPLDPATSKIAEGGVKEHTAQCIKNLEQVLLAAGSSLEKCVEVNVFLADMDDFKAMNDVYSEYFGDVKPARTCVAVKTLPMNVDVEIKCMATL